MGSLPGGKAWVLLFGFVLLGAGVGLAPAAPGTDGTTSLTERALSGTAAARLGLQTDALAAYEALVAERAALAPSLEWAQATRNAAAARALLDAAHADDTVALTAAVAHAQALQADLAPTSLPATETPLPSVAVLALLADHDVVPDASTLLAVHALDLLAAPTRDALAETVTAFRAFQFADRGVADVADMGPLLQARTALLEAAFLLGAALDDQPAKSGPLQIENIIALDLGPGANTYTSNVMLLIDAGGDDVYLNNAGGNGIFVSPCSNMLRAQTALIDLGGDDHYGNGRSCGANGGAVNGAALLLDRSGNDVYIGGAEATNGGARSLGSALLYDVRGDDIYSAGSMATNGGALQFSLGALVDGAGNDRYTAGALGTNGGAAQTAFGLLADVSGDDTYSAQGTGTNGGGAFSSVGLLLDQGGRDHYSGGSGGTNGGGDHFGVGLLYDGNGADTYVGVRLGSNGGASRAGLGSLVDGAGSDRYEAIGRGVNGGGYGGGTGNLIDAGGDDTYWADGEGANGGAFFGEAADTRVCPLSPVCFRPQGTWGLLLDATGTDAYRETLTEILGTDLTIVPKGTVGAQVDWQD